MKIIFVLSLVFLILSIYSCDDTILEIEKIKFPETNVSYQKQVQPVLNAKCATVGCHDDANASGGLILTDYFSTVRPGIVDKGSPETSRLVWRIDGTSPKPMPPFGSRTPPLTKEQVKGIITWIREGARNN